MHQPAGSIEHQQGVVKPSAAEDRAPHEQLHPQIGSQLGNGVQGLIHRTRLEAPEIHRITGRGAFREQDRIRTFPRRRGGRPLDLAQIGRHGLGKDHLHRSHPKNSGGFRIRNIRRQVSHGKSRATFYPTAPRRPPQTHLDRVCGALNLESAQRVARKASTIPTQENPFRHPPITSF